jgi:hypothetical protein
VLPTPSTAYTEYSILRAQHTLITAYMAYCIILLSTAFCSLPASHLSADHAVLNSLHSHNYNLTHELSLSSHHTFFPNNRFQIVRLLVLLQPPLIMASKCIYTFAPLLPPSTSRDLFNHGLQVHHQTRSITASKCISKYAKVQYPRASLNLLHYTLQVYLQTQLIGASRLT